MEGQGVAASAASEAGRHGEPGAGAVVAADFDDPGVSHVTSDTSGGGEGQRRNGDDTLVMPALGRPDAPGEGPSSGKDPGAGPSASEDRSPGAGPSSGESPSPAGSSAEPPGLPGPPAPSASQSPAP